MKIVHSFLLIVVFIIFMVIVISQPFVASVITDSGYEVADFFSATVVIVSSFIIVITAITGGR